MRSTKRSRRSFLRAAGAAGTVALAARGMALARALEASQSVADRSSDDVAKDESYWREIQMDFKLDEVVSLLRERAVALEGSGHGGSDDGAQVGQEKNGAWDV